MSTAAAASALYPRIIIHHLSDLHYQLEQPQGSTDNTLTRYRGYLDQLETAKRPNLIVITGDLTASGETKDLLAVAAMLRGNFPLWAGELSKHIFVVPGPHDVNWEGKDPPGLKAFYDAFHDFGLPSIGHGLPQVDASVGSQVTCVAYPLDTCYTLDECRQEMKLQFQDYAAEVDGFAKQYQNSKPRPTFPLLIKPDRKAQLAPLREKFLSLTEANDLVLLDAGRVLAADFQAFNGWASALPKASTAGQPPAAGHAAFDPLKILITHHPLAVEPESGQPRQGATSASAPRRSGGVEIVNFDALAKAAGDAGFHLALHGHIHKPQVLSDLSLLQEDNEGHPLRQVGAGSLGDGRTFNEITAIYTPDGNQNHWRLEIRTINLKSDNPHAAIAWVLLNRTEDSAKRAEELERKLSIRAAFEKDAQNVMRTFSEDVYDTQPEDPFDRSRPTMLPQRALQGVEGIIQRVVYPGFDARTRLYLKDKHSSKTVPQLTATYLAPLYSDAGPVTYPDSLAALALVLGRTVIYPRDLSMRLAAADYRWFRQSKKDQELINTLEALERDPPSTGLTTQEAAHRYRELLKKLKESMADDGKNEPLTGMDFYRKMPEQTGRPTYPVFICLPYPQRPPEGVGAQLPEVSVLVVSVPNARAPLAAPAPGGATPTPIEEEATTEERIVMLESLTQLIGTILIGSSAAGRPKGVWDDRLKF